MSGQKVKIKTFELILGARDGGLLASCNCLTEIRFSLISSHTITIAAFVPEFFIDMYLNPLWFQVFSGL